MKINLLNKEELSFWKRLIVKSFVMFGFTYFSVAVSLQNWTLVTPALLSSCLYLFSELMKYYKLQPEKKVLTSSVKKNYNFLL